MPFSNVTADSSNIYLANGIMEEIRNSLAKIRNLRVSSKTSTKKYLASTLSLFEIADELNVNYLVEGSIQRQGDILKIHAELIDVQNDDHMYAETYTSDINEIFSVQSEVAQAIAGHLKVIISPEERKIIEKKPTLISEAYDLYLRGKEFFNRGGESNLNMAINFYERAIELDKNFALAYVWLGMAYFQQSFWDDYYKENFGDTMKYLANKALMLNPDLSDGYWLLAEYYWQRAEYDSCIEYAKNAIDLNPNNSYAYEIMGKGYYYTRDYSNALINFEKAREILVGDIDRYPNILDWLGTFYMAIGDFNKAHEILEEILDYDLFMGYTWLSFLNLFYGDFNNAKIYLDTLCALDTNACRFPLMYYYIATEKFEKFNPEQDDLGLFSLANDVWKSHILTNLNKEKEAKEYFDKAFDYLNKTIELKRIDGTGGLSQYDLSAQYAFIKEKDKAFEILYEMEELQNLEGWMLWWMPYDPRFESIRNETEFTAIIERQNNRYAEIRDQIDELEKAGVI
jgi:TolB-like protein/lipoprotein NlpI